MNINMNNNSYDPNMKKTITLCKSITSVSSIVGSVTSVITEFYKSKFPENYFKKVHISTSLSANSLQKDYYQLQERPYLFIQPQYDLSDGVMNQLPLWHTASWYVLNDMDSNYTKIFEDVETGIRIYTIPNRIKITFNTGIRVNTEIQAWNVLAYLKQNFESNGFYYLNDVFLANTVPKFIIENICNRIGLDFNSPRDREKLQKYLLQNSKNAIEEVTDLSTGNPSWVYKSPRNILVNYLDLAQNDKQMNNRSVIQNQITFSLTAELWVPGHFIVQFDNKERFKNMPFVEFNPYVKDDESFKFTSIVNVDYIKYEKEEKKLIMKRDFIPDMNVEFDELDLSPVLPKGIDEISKILLNEDIDLRKVFLIDVYINGRMINKNTFIIDFQNLILKTYNPMSNTTYTVVIYANMEIINTIDILSVKTDSESKKLLKDFLQSLK